MSSLPPEIITTILIRLPVKSLLRFRCVSKPWLAEIDGPDFIKLHLTHSMSSPSKLYPIDDHTDTLYSLDSDSLEKPEKIEIPFLNPYTPTLLNNINGLLLLRPNDGRGYSHRKYQGLILFNPSTRKHLFLPSPPPETKYADVGYVHQTNYLGYDVINNDYKVFNFLLLFEYTTHKFISCEARVYSLKSNLWHIVKDLTKGMIIHCSFDSYLNGALHSVNGVHRNIVALDVGKETFSFMHLPNFRNKNLSLLRTHVFDGYLAFICRYSDGGTDIWVMKEYGVKESWCMLFSVKLGFPYLTVLPMVYSKSRTEVLLIYDCKLVWYDLRKNTVRGFQVSGLPDRIHPIVCVESLVSIDVTAKSIEKKRRHTEEKMKLQFVKKKRDSFKRIQTKGFTEA